MQSAFVKEFVLPSDTVLVQLTLLKVASLLLWWDHYWKFVWSKVYEPSTTWYHVNGTLLSAQAHKKIRGEGATFERSLDHTLSLLLKESLPPFSLSLAQPKLTQFQSNLQHIMLTRAWTTKRCYRFLFFFATSFLKEIIHLWRWRNFFTLDFWQK